MCPVGPEWLRFCCEINYVMLDFTQLLSLHLLNRYYGKRYASIGMIAGHEEIESSIMTTGTMSKRCGAAHMGDVTR